MPQMIFQVCDLFLSHETEFGRDSESSSTFGHGTTAVTVHPPTQPRSASAECAEAASPASLASAAGAYGPTGWRRQHSHADRVTGTGRFKRPRHVLPTDMMGWQVRRRLKSFERYCTTFPKMHRCRGFSCCYHKAVSFFQSVNSIYSLSLANTDFFSSFIIFIAFFITNLMQSLTQLLAHF